jgi:hypothetical protein
METGKTFWSSFLFKKKDKLDVYFKQVNNLGLDWIGLMNSEASRENCGVNWPLQKVEQQKHQFILSTQCGCHLLESQVANVHVSNTNSLIIINYPP